ncbi:nucleoside deaminase [Arthrobacter sp. APC 3897]|uniref:nucleoside deaminase n=1 Tax=Arthrobacter sp. APC 3897 TaxID=3035204 RepID=UPI0025B2B434|nr:nucleoside deaminase [Arthrobacter sp. APC 3897]MDN3480712.1 nucleoside deaminase [Arthrobacter sp. APC 3897]
MSMTISDAEYLARAINLATENVAAGGGPFGAVVVTADGSVFEGVNRVTANHDPTAHAEVTAIRAAGAGTGTHDLSGAVLYTSCEPCPMCLASSLWARLDRVVFAADRHDAARAGFDDAVFYEYFETPVEERSLQVTQVAVEDVPATAPFEAWTAAEDRIDY